MNGELKNLTSKNIGEYNNQKITALHYRTHQLYGVAKKRNDKKAMEFYKKKHQLIVNEMKKRKIVHNSPLNENFKTVCEILEKNEYGN